MEQPLVPQMLEDALAQNLDAANALAMMTKAQKNAVYSKARKVRTPGQMESLAASLITDRPQ